MQQQPDLSTLHPYEQSAASIQLADLMPSSDEEELSNLLDMGAQSLVGMSVSSSLGSIADAAEGGAAAQRERESGAEADTSSASLVSISFGMLHREAAAFSRHWEVQEEKEKSRRLSIGANVLSKLDETPQKEKTEDRASPGDLSAQAAPVAEDAERSAHDTSAEQSNLRELGLEPVLEESETEADQSHSISPEMLPLPPSPIRAEDDTSLVSTASQPRTAFSRLSATPSPASQRSEHSSVDQARQRHSTPPVLASPASLSMHSPSLQRQERRLFSGDLRRQLARKSMGTPVSQIRSPGLRQNSPLSRLSIGANSQRTNSSFASFGTGSPAAVGGERSSRLFFDAADETANLSAVFETARELDEVHAERAAELVERLQQGDEEINTLRKTLQTVASSELDALRAFEELKRRAETAELALLREKEEALAAAQLQDQQHAEVAALIERLKAEIEQQQIDTESRIASQHDAYLEQEAQIAALQEELAAVHQQRLSDSRDFEIRLLAARQEEQQMAAARLVDEVNKARESTMQACERDFAIRQAREAEDVKITQYTLEDRLASTEEQLSLARNSEEKLKSELDQAFAQIDEQLKELEEVQATLQERDAAPPDPALEERLAELEEELARARQHMQEIEEEKSGLAQASQRLQLEVMQLGGRLEGTSALLAERDRSLANIKAENDNLRRALEDAPLHAPPADSDARDDPELRAALADAKRKIAKLEFDSANRGIELTRLQKQKQQLEIDNRNYGIAL